MRIQQEFIDLKSDDNRKSIFCVPIILYMCCHEGVRISEHNSVAGIYSAVFDKLYKEKAYQKTTQLNASNEIQYRISWQFTKELAYQMHLHGKLETAIGGDLVKNAMNRTKAVLREKMPQDKELEKVLKDITEDDFDQYFQTHFAIMHFQSGDIKHGAEFAHKTVGEYFTAVKLYEDYFECIKNPETTTEQVWRNIFEAFRYKYVPDDILNFLVEQTKKGLGDPPEKLFEHYYRGMEKQMLWKMMNEPVVDEYPFDWIELLLPERIGYTFHMLINFLTAIGFDNMNGDAKIIRRVFTSYFPDQSIDVTINLKKWNLKKTVLSGIDLCGTNLSGANLSEAFLVDTYLGNADLSGANLMGASLGSTNLISANLSCADLRSVDLQDAKLGGADLTDARMYESDYKKLPDYVRQKYTYNSQTGRLESKK
ncbi:MAG: pentapeptide repeat-containing protein [Oscillospiraceae bacterium]|nr:pentapeptide repeat-containing protein [Oscillospiraceae bacterium]